RICALGLASRGCPKPQLGSQSGHDPAATLRTNASIWACQTTWMSRSKNTSPPTTALPSRTTATSTRPARAAACSRPGRSSLRSWPEALPAELKRAPSRAATIAQRLRAIGLERSRSVNFSVVGFSFFAKMLCSGGSGEECRVGDLPELDRGGHGPATGQGDPPAARAWDFGDESVRMETAEQPWPGSVACLRLVRVDKK